MSNLYETPQEPPNEMYAVVYLLFSICGACVGGALVLGVIAWLR